ncbi:hypothetical protein JCM5350_002009 [Sporobolomyces pararoseus]
MDSYQSAEEAPPDYNSFSHYDPTQDAHRLALNDLNMAHRHQEELETILGKILQNRANFSREDFEALKRWKAGVWTALSREMDWNMCHEANWDKTKKEFTTIHQGKLSLRKLGRKPSPLDGRHRILENLLRSIMLAIQSQMVDVNKLARRWLNPIRKAIDDDPRNLIHSEKWYRIVAVLTEIMKDQMTPYLLAAFRAGASCPSSPPEDGNPVASHVE